MMWYMIMATDTDDSVEIRRTHQDAYLKRLQALKQEDRLLTVGCNPVLEHDPNVSGSLIIAQFQNLDDAQKWVEEDPYALVGVYEEVLIKPYQPIY